MTLTALNTQSSEIICPITMQRRAGVDRAAIVALLRRSQDDLICPHCHALHKASEPVRLVNDPSKRLFFRHTTKESDRACVGASKSEQHLRVQIEFSQWLEDEGYGHCELEKHLPEIGRIADIYLEGDNGYKAVYEVQLSAIRADELQARTDDYKKIGLDVFWLLGKRAKTEENMWWSQNNLGRCIVLRFKDNEDALEANAA